eukprot:scaffold24_cov341-Pavlova_lutheri.AAC.32
MNGKRCGPPTDEPSRPDSPRPSQNRTEGSTCTHVGLPTQCKIHQKTQTHQHSEQRAHLLPHAAVHVQREDVRIGYGFHLTARPDVFVPKLQLQGDEVTVTDETQVLEPIDPHRNVVHVKTAHQHDRQHRDRGHGLGRLNVLIQGPEQKADTLGDQGAQDDRAQVRQEGPTVALQSPQPVQKRHHDCRRDPVHGKVRQRPGDVVRRQLVHATRSLLGDHPELVREREQCRE